MKIIKHFNVKLTQVQVKQIRRQLRGVNENFAIIAQPRMKLFLFEIEKPSMDVAVVDTQLHHELNVALNKARTLYENPD